MVKTALFETLLESATENADGSWTFTLEGKSYNLANRDDVRKIAEEHGYIIIY